MWAPERSGAPALGSFGLFNPSCAGADLLVEQLGPGVEGREKENPNVFLVGATCQRLLSGAEEVGLFKEYNDGSMRGFTCANKLNFTQFVGNVSLSVFFIFADIKRLKRDVSLQQRL